MGQLPTTYLGLPIGGNSSRLATWEPVINRMNLKLASWKGKMLSIGGRLTLIKASLSSLPLYYMSFYPIPKGVIDKIVAIQRNFLWSGQEGKRALPLVAWAHLELPKSLGGLGIGNLLHRNLALMFKWIWRFFEDSKALWRSIISDKYGYPPSFTILDLSIPKSGGPWKSICKNVLSHPFAKDFGKSKIRKNVGRGTNTLFWHELWVGEAPLKMMFPRLFKICINPLATIESLGIWDGHEWHWIIPWKRNLRPQDCVEKEAMFNLLKSVTLDLACEDSMVWTPDKGGSFSVKSATFELAKSSNMVHQDIIRGIWKGLVPHRVEVFAWLAILEKINTRAKLLRLGIIHPENSQCVLCNHTTESSNHLLLHCCFSSLLWSWWLSLWNLSWAQPESLKECFLQWRAPRSGLFFKKIWGAVFFIIIWTIWKERNARIFNNSSSSIHELQDLILLRLCWWLKAWEDDFPYSPNEVLRNPICLNWNKIGLPNRIIHQPTPQVWSPPLNDTLMWNVDASFKHHLDHAAVGGVLRNTLGNFICLFSSPIPLLEINSA